MTAFFYLLLGITGFVLCTVAIAAKRAVFGGC